MRRRRSIFDIMWEYMEELERRTDELMREVFEKPSWDLETRSLEPLFNISVTPDEVIVTADMPYVDPETVEIERLDEDLIEVSAKMRVKVTFRDLGIRHREGEFSCFRCRVPLPVPVEVGKAKIRVRRGILEIRLPRKRGYRIEVE
ncbi:Hsp20/alpha crystallin family protein [Candidatus Bathyarchaeota archaeon]|nr:Hsp20/alpha crystallin family protein [Candidatus Bathyarchaeota archaeon]